MDLIDSHAHIDGPQFAEDREAMLQRAQAAGVSTILAIGTGPGPEKLDAALPYAESHNWIYTTVGIHPHPSRNPRRPSQTPQSNRLGRNRPRLFLRSLSPRPPRKSLPRTNGTS